MSTVGRAAAIAPPLEGIGLLTSMTRFFSHAFELRGRASRSEYWWWMLVNALVLTATQVVLPALFLWDTPQAAVNIGPFGSWLLPAITLITINNPAAIVSPITMVFSIIGGAWAVLTLIPGVTVAVRRLHDSNLSGWWALLAIAPPGAIILMFLALRGSRFEGVRFD